jgi:prokaryotic ubiquitin-like protein Pup
MVLRVSPLAYELPLPRSNSADALEEEEPMSEQRRKTQTPRPDESQESSKPQFHERGKKLSENLDALLDEIDGILEENAAEFVENYVQRGGQ